MGPGRVRAGASGPLRPSGGYSGGDYLSSGDPDFAAEVSGFGDTGTYAVLALAPRCTSYSCALFPSQTADYLFGPGGAPSLDLYKPLFRLLGVNLLSAAAKSYLLKNAAGLGTLNRRGNMRLNLSLITLGLGSAGVAAARHQLPDRQGLLDRLCSSRRDGHRRHCAVRTDFRPRG
eukprot:jgi/Botrbrau1/16687/Bobra.0267s0003.1